MITTDGGVLGAAELESLLPWYAAGTLSRGKADALERALARSPELARRLDLIRQERAETIHLNRSLGTPSARPMAKLLAAIEAEDASKQRTPDR
jgi:hypothetical protein